MRAKEFITEEPSLEQFQSYKDLNQYANENCQPYLQMAGGFKNAVWENPLYRGTYQGTNDWEIVRIRKDRKPMSTPNEIQQMIDSWFKRKSGVYYRKTSMFTTHNIERAKNYGPINIVLPVGNFKFAWSPIYGDLWVALLSYIWKLPHSKEDEQLRSRDMVVKYATQEIIDQFMELGEYQFNTGMAEAIKSNNEIMINGKEAVIIKHHFVAALVQE